jgi:hypothetical protein
MSEFEEINKSVNFELSNNIDLNPILSATKRPDDNNNESSVENKINFSSNISVKNEPLKASDVENKEKNPIVNEESSSNRINSCFASHNSKVNDIHQLFDNKDIINIINEVKINIQKYSEILYNENQSVDLDSNLLYYFQELEIIYNNNNEYDHCQFDLIGTSLKITYYCKYKIANDYYFKCIPIKKFELNEENNEKYSLYFLEQTYRFYPEKKDEKKNKNVTLKNFPAIEINLNLEDSSKRFYIFALGLYNKYKLLFNNAIILFFIDIEKIKKKM